MKKILSMTALAAIIGLLYGCDNHRDAADGLAPSSSSSTLGQKIDKTASTTGQFIDDASITAAVKAELAKEENISSMQINVDTQNGNVHLSGKLPSTELIKKAEEAARRVPDVKTVISSITVEEGVIDKAKNSLANTGNTIKSDASRAANKTEQVAQDAKISTLIKTEAFKDEDLSVLDIKSEVEKGHVILSGTASTEEAKTRIINRVKNIEGVTGVEDNIQISRRT